METYAHVAELNPKVEIEGKAKSKNPEKARVFLLSTYSMLKIVLGVANEQMGYIRIDNYCQVNCSIKQAPKHCGWPNVFILSIYLRLSLFQLGIVAEDALLVEREAPW